MGLRAAAASIDITPAAPCALAGYAARRNTPYTAIHDRLELNAVRLTDGVQDIVIISGDMLSFGHVLEQAARSALPQGMQLICLASHTHFAPATDPHLPRLGETDPIYMSLAVSRTVSLVRNLLQQKLEDARVAYGAGVAGNAIHRRRKGWRISGRFPFVSYGMQMRPNTDFAHDETVHCIHIKGAEDSTMAVLWAYACHPVGFDDRGMVSADYIGIVRDALRKTVKSGVPVVFCQGFSGDLRPNSVQNGKFIHFTRDNWEEWSKSIASVVVSGVLRADNIDNAMILAQKKHLPLSDLLVEAPLYDRPGLEWQQLRIGSLGFDILSGEPVQGIGRYLKAESIRVGYAGHVWGYLPTPEMLAQGGYEVKGFMPDFSLDGPFVADLDARLQAFFEV